MRLGVSAPRGLSVVGSSVPGFWPPRSIGGSLQGRPATRAAGENGRRSKSLDRTMFTAWQGEAKGRRRS